MDSSDVCSTEDAVNAFIEYLVDPMLPVKHYKGENVSLSQQQSVAKQVHSVVLLYNYYLRKQYPELAFLSFHEFCKLAMALRPTLSVHMTSTQKPDETEFVDVEKQLSLTEKSILNACKVCTWLDASKNVPDIEGLPISKVAVLLIDSKKENCCLLFSSITAGVWSVVEKDVNTFGQSSEATGGADGAKYTYKKKRVTKMPTKFELNSEEDGILRIGYAAVKEAAGLNKTDVTILESHTVYSQSKAKTVSRFYIMKCSHLINQESQVSIKYLIESLQGPLVRRSCGSWASTSVVEYFHVFPYSEIISEWISRETFSNSLQDSRLAVKNMMVSSPEETEPSMSSKSMSVNLNIKSNSDAIEARNQKKNNGNCGVRLFASLKEAEDLDVDNSLASVFKNKEWRHIANISQVREGQEIEISSVRHYSNQSKTPTKAEKGDPTSMLITEANTRHQSTCDKICAKTSFENDSIAECALTANNPNTDIEKLQILTASKKTLSQTAKTSVKNDCIEEHTSISNNPYSDLEKPQILTLSKEKTLSRSAKTLVKNDSIEEHTLIAYNPNSDLEKPEILTASTAKTLSQAAKTSVKNYSIEEHTSFANNPNSDLEKLQIFMASKGKTLSQTALNYLMRKRNALALQQRTIEDEIALCDKKIQRILSSGEDDLELKLESIIEGCNDSWVKNQGRTSQHLHDQSLPQCSKRRRLTEAVLIMKSPCQELDDVCHGNNWVLPIYHLSESDGGIKATVAVKGLDFESSSGGEICSHPQEARESAAAEMLATLRRMAKSDQ